jgi:hypothetical protein
MTTDSQVVLFGPPNEGKTFVALSMALSIALGVAARLAAVSSKRGETMSVRCELGTDRM